MDKMTEEVRLEYWADVVQRCNSSGKVKRQWCEENGIHEKQYYYWQRRIRKFIYTERNKAVEVVGPVFAEIPIACIENIPEAHHSNNLMPAMQNPTLKLNKGSINIEISNMSGSDLLAFTKELLTDA